MDKNFKQLSKQKQNRILKAALEVFAQNDYKSAGTDDIAAKAGISKGLLFYYFKNKQMLYLYVVRQLQKMIEDHLQITEKTGLTDFFDIVDYGINEKMRYLKDMPHVMEFSVRMFYTSGGELGGLLQKYTAKTLEEMLIKYFSHVDENKFKPGFGPRETLDMLVWLTDGYMHARMREDKPIDLDDMVKHYGQWRAMLRQYVYKEEFL